MVNELQPIVEATEQPTAAETAITKYVFLDIVGYSRNRSVEAQTDIITALNSIVREAVGGSEAAPDRVIYIPTGDGICIALIEQSVPYDLPILVALDILRLLSEYNSKQQDPMRRFAVRIGINENIDNIVTDINGRRNVAGAGINYAQRIMSKADGGNILVGEGVHNYLSQREKYLGKFKAFTATVKHGLQMSLYQLADQSVPCLNSAIPEALRPKPVPQKEEFKFTKLVAYLIGHIAAKRDFILQHLDSPQGRYSLFVLMTFLANDSVEASEATDFDPFVSYMPKTEHGTLEEVFEHFESLDFSLICNYGDMFYDMHVAPSWGLRYFKPLSQYLELEPEALVKLKREWPEIAKELGLA